MYDGDPARISGQVSVVERGYQAPLSPFFDSGGSIASSRSLVTPLRYNTPCDAPKTFIEAAMETIWDFLTFRAEQ